MAPLLFLWRDRRRHLLCATLLLAAGYASFLDDPPVFDAISFPPLAGLACVIGILPLGVGLCRIIPPWRFACEVAALTLAIWALAGRHVPEFSCMALAQGFGPSFWGFLLTAIILSQLYCGDFLDRLTHPGRWMRHRLTSRLPARVLWDGLVATPPHADRLASRTIRSLEYIDGTRDRRVVDVTDMGETLVEHHHVAEIDAPRLIRFRWEAQGAQPGHPFATGTREVRITDTGRRRIVEVRSRCHAFAWRATLMTWIDDGLGRLNDTTPEILEKRHGQAPDDPGDAAAARSVP